MRVPVKFGKSEIVLMANPNFAYYNTSANLYDVIEIYLDQNPREKMRVRWLNIAVPTISVVVTAIIGFQTAALLGILCWYGIYCYLRSILEDRADQEVYWILFLKRVLQRRVDILAKQETSLKNEAEAIKKFKEALDAIENQKAEL